VDEDHRGADDAEGEKDLKNRGKGAKGLRIKGAKGLRNLLSVLAVLEVVGVLLTLIPAGLSPPTTSLR